MSRKSTKRKMVTDEELKHAFVGTNYGPEPDYKKIVKWGLMKISCGYTTGHTTKCILQELGLLCRSKISPTLTSRGRYCLWEFFRHEYRNE